MKCLVETCFNNRTKSDGITPCNEDYCWPNGKYTNGTDCIEIN